jgi:hypothetical protein
MENKKTQELVDILEVQGVKAHGFGIIPKIVMQDTRLSVTAKAIYAYFCSFAGAGSQAFPGVKKICIDLGITNDTFLKHRKQLEQHGYIIVKNVRDGGKFSRNIYVITEKPENTEFPPCPKKPDTVKNRHGEKPYRKNHDTKINSNIKSTNNNKNNNNGVVDFISIFSEQGINIKPVIHKNPEVFTDFTEKDIRLIAETLAKKQGEGKILNPVGMLLSDPRAVAEAILTGKFYPSKKTTTTKYDDAEIYVPPPGIY